MADQRWTCEACGCFSNTEAENQLSCGLCGTARRRSLFAVDRSNSQESFGNDSMDEDDMHYNNEDEDEDEDVFDRMESAGIPSSSTGAIESGSCDNIFQLNDEEAQELYDRAFSDEQMSWSRLYKGRSIRVFGLDDIEQELEYRLSGKDSSAAYSSSGSCIAAVDTREGGRSVRAVKKLPNIGVVGWKILFNSGSSKRVGEGLGGCYLIGVVSDKFEKYTDLQHSGQFYGVEDSGRRYEGSKRLSSCAPLLQSKGRGQHLYGEKQTVSIVADLDNHKLHFWREFTYLGALVDIPTSNLFPVAVPFNENSHAYISNLAGNPLKLMMKYDSQLAELKEARNKKKRGEISEAYYRFFDEQNLSAKLKNVLKTILSWYDKKCETEGKMSRSQALRFLYRSGLGIDDICKYFDNCEENEISIERLIKLMLDTINRKAEVLWTPTEDDHNLRNNANNDDDSDEENDQSEFEVGDKVCLSEFTLRYNEVKKGPLYRGNIGTIIFVQDEYPVTVRVAFNGKRGTYHPQDLVTERSGLLEPSSLTLMKGILRVHGFSDSFEPLWGQPFEKFSCMDNDFVFPLRPIVRQNQFNACSDKVALLGKVRDESVEDKSMLRSSDVLVEFLGCKSLKRMKLKDLVFTTFYHGVPLSSSFGNDTNNAVEEHAMDFDTSEDESKVPSSRDSANEVLSEEIKAAMDGVANLERSSIISLAKSFKSSTSLLHQCFGSYLPDAILTALSTSDERLEADVVKPLVNFICIVVSRLLNPELLSPPIPNQKKLSASSSHEEGVEEDKDDSMDIVNILDLERAFPPEFREELLTNTSALRDLVRDLGSDSNDARSVLLALLAGGRGNPLTISSRREGGDPQEGGFLSRLLSRSSRNPEPVTKKRSGTSTNKSLVNDGILCNSLKWVKHALESGAEVNHTDGEGRSVIFLAVLMQSDLTILKELIASGAKVTQEVIDEAAKSGQTGSLEFLLRYFTYCESSSYSMFTKDVKKVIEAALERQKSQENLVTSKAPKFAAQIIAMMIRLIHKAECEGRSGRARLFLDALFGDVLTKLISKAQFDSLEKNEADCDDIREPAYVHESSGKIKYNLIELVSPALIREAAMKEDKLKSFFLLTEKFLWSKNLNDVATGLVLATTLIQSTPSNSQFREVRRFGFNHLVSTHMTKAEGALCLSTDSEFIVKCPKKHVTLLHLTKHSSFRCDLCSKGVDQGQAMFGCRTCDFDICMKCSDENLKWAHVRDMCVVFLDLFSTSDIGDTKYSSEVDNVVEGIKLKNTSSLTKLHSLLEEKSKITLYEFSSKILPALYSVLVYSKENSIAEVVQTSGGKLRKRKKARVGRGNESDNEKAAVFLADFINNFFNIDELSSNSGTDDEECYRMLEQTEDGEIIPRIFKKVARPMTPEILQRLHSILSFDQALKVVRSTDPNLGELESLTAPFELSLIRSPLVSDRRDDTARDSLNDVVIRLPTDEAISGLKSVLLAEPLLPVMELKDHILRTTRIKIPFYVEFCKKLVRDRAIIAIKPVGPCEVNVDITNDEYHLNGGRRVAQVVSFDEKTGIHHVKYASQLNCDGTVTGNEDDLADQIVFNGKESSLVLATRDYCILYRGTLGLDSITESENLMLIDQEMCNDEAPIGMRIESNITGEWELFTIRSSLIQNSSKFYDLVTDNGEVYFKVPDLNIRGLEKHSKKSDELPEGTNCDSIFIARSPKPCKAGVIKRTWSALSSLSDLNPLNLIDSAEDEPIERTRKMSIGGNDIEVNVDMETVEKPPKFLVELSLYEDIDPMPVNDNKTLFNVLYDLQRRKKSNTKSSIDRRCSLFYSVSLVVSSSKMPYLSDTCYATCNIESPINYDDVYREDLGDTCVKCLQLIDLISNEVNKTLQNTKKSYKSLKGFKALEDRVNGMFVSKSLTEILLEQLDDPLMTVSGCLPTWTRRAPSLAPCAFSLASRELLLDRTIFGVSRAAYRQQEAKCNVANLRERMASLRSRAVALVGEAFGGRASDPTALQLQADELYSMEEALAARVNAQFRAKKWDERSLDAAKATVKRDRLLEDTALMMDNYVKDKRARHRRLEVRFEGESGFDATSGEEAGVTRGFYADVAECFLSCENDLILWIPDKDLSLETVMPTPRADMKSSLGVYPQPIGPNHPNRDAILDRFQLIGRLFAAALRDGASFPLPLSSSFLKLVQIASEDCDGDNNDFSTLSISPFLEEFYISGSSVSAASSDSADSTAMTDDSHSMSSISSTINVRKKMGSLDLPRPGFLGGEIYAVEKHILPKLQKIEIESLPELEKAKLRSEIASDPSFARIALGKNYECSFEDYFEGKTFVDPFDPGQGENALSICPFGKGHEKTVTIENIQEWVKLARKFVLYDGVIAQAKAFRRGINDFYSSQESLSLFTAEELQKKVCGSGDNVDIWDEDYVRTLLKMDGGKELMGSFTPKLGPFSPTIQMLIRTLLEADELKRRQFLSFTTSLPITGPKTYIEVLPILGPEGDFLRMNDPHCLPRANTCAKKLYLPKFESYESFSKTFWAVVTSECRFKGFYEWKG